MSPAPRILIVEDELLNVDALEQQLEGFGYRTQAARNGREALAKAGADPPDLILLDVMMPVMDGLTACRKLKEDPATRSIPIVIMTALHGAEDESKARAAGARDYLVKPVDAANLRMVIEAALGQARAGSRGAPAPLTRE